MALWQAVNGGSATMSKVPTIIKLLSKTGQDDQALKGIDGKIAEGAEIPVRANIRQVSIMLQTDVESEC